MIASVANLVIFRNGYWSCRQSAAWAHREWALGRSRSCNFAPHQAKNRYPYRRVCQAADGCLARFDQLGDDFSETTRLVVAWHNARLFFGF